MMIGKRNQRLEVSTARQRRFWSWHCTQFTRPSPFSTLCFLLLSSFLIFNSPNIAAQTDPDPNQPPKPTTEETTSEESNSEAFWQQKEMDQMLKLAEYLEPSSVYWIDNQGGTAQQSPIPPGKDYFLGIYEREFKGDAVGAVLILHGQGQHPHWQGSQQKLLEILPAHGWNTLAISLPDIGFQHPPKRPAPPQAEPQEELSADSQKDEDAQAQAKEADTTLETSNEEMADGEESPPSAPTRKPLTAHLESPESAEMRALQRIRTSIGFLNDQGQFNIVILGYGASGARIADYINQVNASPSDYPIRSLVLVDASNQVLGSDADLSAIKLPENLAVLDITTQSSQEIIHHAERRQKHAQRSRWQNYALVRLHPYTRGEESLATNQLNRRIRGFLENNAKGVKVENATVKKAR